MPRNYVSNKDESARLFKSEFLEKFTHVHPLVPVAVFVPVIVYLLFRASEVLRPRETAALFVSGVLTWTLAEYLLHRFVFHHQPSSAWGKKLHFLMHGVHHDYPNDSLRLVMPPAVSIPLALAFYALFTALMGPDPVWAFFPGFLAGYLCYDLIHYATHHFGMKGRVALALKQHHMRHHYQDPGANYGVSSPVWDFVFGTYQKKKREE
ncbi:MAG: sterol desaturase family protein [Bacteroidota bacterium]